jgi:hypothetical protein
MMLARCMFCFSENGCQLKFTKKGLPYISCRVCYTRAFFHGLEALRGVAVCPELIQMALEQVADGKGGWVRERTAAINKFVRDKMKGEGLREPLPEPVPYSDHADAKENIPA